MERIENELAHGRKISQDIGFYLGWSGAAGQLRAERRAEMYKAAGKIGPGKKILEIGCGPGIFTSMIAPSGADITAVDLSPELIRMAGSGNPAPNVKYLIMNAEKLEFRDNSFDCVYGSSVMHHLDLDKTLPEMLRVLKPGGNLVFTEPNMLNPQIMLQKNIPPLKALLGDSPDETAFFRWRIKGLLLDAGFSEVKTEPFDFLHPRVPGALAATVDSIGIILERLPMFREIAGSLLIKAAK